MVYLATASVSRGTLRSCLLLSALLVGAGFFYPPIAAYQQRAAIERLLFADDLSAADRSLDRLLGWNPRDERACYLKAVLLRRSSRAEEYRQWRERAESLGTPVELLDLQDRFLSVQQGNVNKSTEPELLAQAEKLASDSIAAQTYEAIARGYLTTYRLKEAWQCLDYWLEWRPAALSARLMRGEILIRTGMPVQAAAEYRKILEQAPDNAIAKERLATTLLKLNEVDEASQMLRDVCRDNPQAAQPWIELAEAERRLGNLEPAREAIEVAFRLGVDPRQRGQCCSILGQLSLADQHPAEAAELLLAATELSPEDATAHHALGSALALSGQPELGKQHRDRAQSIRENYDQVQKWTRQVIEHPNDPELRVRIGQALIEQGLRSEGIQWIQTALVCDSQFAPARELLDEIASTHGSAP